MEAKAMPETDPTFAVVVVQWFIKPGREADFLKDRKPIRRAPGFIGESLFRATVDTDEPGAGQAVVYLNIGHWRSRSDFYRKFRHLKPGVVPDLNDYEAAPRRRHWLGPVA